MQIKYIPNKGIVINGNEIYWNENRSKIRTYLENKHREDNQNFTLDSYFDGDEIIIINQRRDIYKDFYSDENLFFLNYNENDKFIEFEFHIDIDIQIEKINLNSKQDLKEIVNKFEINLKLIHIKFLKLNQGII